MKQKSVYGIGVDIVDVVRLEQKIEKHNHKFAKKILTPVEYTKYLDIPEHSIRQRSRYAAKCWAVKEAFVKALGTGFTNEFTWQDITYTSPKFGRPLVSLSEKSHNNSTMHNKHVHLSVSDEVTNVVAFVTIEEEK